MPYSRTKTWLTIGIVTTLLLGFLLGILANSTSSFMKHKYWLRHRGRKTHVLAEERLLKRLSRKLDLSQSQIQAIGGILRIQSTKIKKARNDYNTKMNFVMKDSQEKIKQHLDPIQKQKYEKLIESHRKKWKNLCRRK